MNRKLTTLALSALVACAGIGTAGAATSTTAKPATQDTCHALAKQAESALTTHKGDAAKGKSVREHIEAGKADCKAGSYEKGAEQLRTAINDLGMKPVI